MSLYRPPRKSSPARLERARLRAEAVRAEHANDPEWQERRRKYHADWRAANRQQVRTYAKDRARFHAVDVRLKRKGLDPDEYRAIVEAHSGECDSCGGGPTGRWPTLDIDHCHQTGAFRGMLCGRCNRAIGLFNDDPALLRKAAAYLEQFKVNE